MRRSVLWTDAHLAAVLLTALTISGCSGSSADNLSPPDSAGQPAAEQLMPSLPADLSKAVSLEDADRFCYGADFASELPNQRVTPQGTRLIFSPNWDAGDEPENDELAYAMYRFALDGYDDQPELAMHWGTAPADWNCCFVGLGNQLHNRWDWFTGDDVAGCLLLLQSLAPYLDDDGGLVLIVLMTGTESCTLGWLRWGSNVPPVAILEADPLSGTAPLGVSFSATSSYDLDGSLTEFEWDFDGDGEFNEPGPEEDARSNPSVYYTYSNAGEYSPTVRVTDNDSAQDLDTQVITAFPGSGWVFVSLELLCGNQISLAVIDGCPAISYIEYEAGTDLLKYARATSVTGVQASDWGAPITIDETDSFGTTSLAEVEGNPAIAYCRWDDSQEKYQLRYARSTTCTGSDAADWSQFATLVTNDGIFLPTLEVVAGNPAIACYYYHGICLKYMRSATTTGTNAADWGTTIRIDGGTCFGGPSLAIVGGNPAISYTHYDTMGLRYVRSTSATGSNAADWLTIVDLGGWYYEFSSLAVVDGNPAITYIDFKDKVQYVRASTATGSNATDWSEAITIELGDNQFQWPSLLVAYGKPLIAYIDYSDWDLKYAQAATASGADPADWSEPDILDDEAGSRPSAAHINGNPAFCYRDASTQVIKYAYFNP